jgi:hypothetical protein
VKHGWRDNARLATAGDPSLTFHTPPGYGDTIRVCASSAIIAPSNCRTFDAGEDFRVRLEVEDYLTSCQLAIDSKRRLSRLKGRLKLSKSTYKVIISVLFATLMLAAEQYAYASGRTRL